MTELPGGVIHWTGWHEAIGQQIHSYYATEAGALIDPCAGDGLQSALDGRRPPGRILLTCRHHLRGSEAVARTFDCEVFAPEPGLHEFEDQDLEVKGYRWGEALAPGIVAHEAGAICPDDAVLHVGQGPGFLAFGDGLIRWNGKLAFVPDFLMDDPEEVKSVMLERIEALIDLQFDGILLAHGTPTRSGGKDELREFLAEPASADFGS